MTEEIIIDCAFYKDGVCASPINNTCKYCKNIDVSKCYHKQLQRLQEKYDTLTNKFLNSETDKTRLKQENEKLKEELQKAMDNYVELDLLRKKSEELLIKDAEYWLNNRNEICKETEIYRKALEEIRKMVNRHLDAKEICYGYQVVDKINEVLNA